MVCFCHKLKIFNAIVRSIVINVVNHFISEQLPPKVLLHYQSVLFELCNLPSNSFLNAHVSSRYIQIFSTFPIPGFLSTMLRMWARLRTFDRAKLSKLCSGIKNVVTKYAVPRKNWDISIVGSCFDYFFECHVLPPLQKIGRAVVQECRSIHSAPTNRNAPAIFLNIYSVA